MTPLSILAQQVVSTPDSPTAWITSGGIVGFLCFSIVAFLRGWVVPGWIHRQQIDAKDHENELLTADRNEMTLFLRNQVMPALTRANDFASTLAEKMAMEERDRVLQSRTGTPSSKSSGREGSS